MIILDIMIFKTVHEIYRETKVNLFLIKVLVIYTKLK